MAEQGIRHHRAASSGQFPLINGIGAGWYEKDCATYGYEFGSWKSRFDLFDVGLERIEARLGQLIPRPVRKIPILIGGAGPKRTLPAVAR
jgi:alkanesulfonate monooxygenase SsuD/methylene tetrahydromethanopterin reductase-like flavin-dependent oxidoreductase (luciferase family)